MTGEGISIGRVFGISIRIHLSWFIILSLMSWSLVTSFPLDWGLAVRVAAAVIASLLFFASVLLHEFMHSLIAIRNKIPVKAITLFVFGGVAQIAEEPREPGVEFRVAIAGPIASIVLGGVLWGIYYLLPPGAAIVIVVASWLGWVNLMLGVFNLIPAFPMDGGRVLRSVIWWRTHNLRRSTRIASIIGKVFAALFIIGGIYLAIFTSYGFNGLWFAFVGWFLYGAASGSYQQLVLQQALQGHVAREVMTSDYTQVLLGMKVDELISSNVLTVGKLCFVVSADACPKGVITAQEIKNVPVSDRASRTVDRIMKPMDRVKTVRPSDSLAAAMAILTEQNVSCLPVMEDGRLLGVIGRDTLLNFINFKESIGSQPKSEVSG